MSGAELQNRFYRSTFPSPPPGAFVLDLLDYDGNLGILGFKMRAPGGKHGLSRVALEIRGVASCPLRDEILGGGAWPEWRYEFTLSREFSSYEIIPLEQPGAPARFEYDPNGHQQDIIQVAIAAPHYELFLVSVVVDGWAFFDSRREPISVESPLVPVIFLPPKKLDQADPDSVSTDAEHGCLDIQRWYTPRLLETLKEASFRDGLSTLSYQLMTAKLSDDDRFTRSVGELGDRAIERALGEISAFARRHPNYPEAQSRLVSLKKLLGKPPSALSLPATDTPDTEAQEPNACADVLPWFMSRELTAEDLVELELTALADMRNEVYARRGWRFKDVKVQKRFEAECWYQPRYLTNEFPADALSTLEHRNIEKIVAAERSRGGPSR